MNYRKQTVEGKEPLPAEDEFRLFAISARFPEGLAKQVALEESQPGVYDIKVGGKAVRLLVIRQLAEQPANAMLKLFSLVPVQIDFACQHYRPFTHDITGIVDQLIVMYGKEDRNMATTLEELNRKIRKQMLESASVEERLKGLTPEQRLEGLPAEERLKGLSAEEIEAYLRTLKKTGA